MSSRNQASERRRRKTITMVWTGLLALVVIALIYWERTALLYILATLGVTALLIVVAMADLDAKKGTEESAAVVPDGTGKLRSTFGAGSASSK